MAKKLNISFKDNEMDMKLYREIIRHTDKSAFVKEAIQFYINSSSLSASAIGTTSTTLSKKTNEANEILNILG